MWRRGSNSALAVLLLLFVFVRDTDQNVRNKRSILPEQARIKTENGQLIFQAGTSSNITFRSGSGGGVYIDNLDLKGAVTQSNSNKVVLDRLQSAVNSRQAAMNDITSRMSRIEQQVTSGSSNDNVMAQVNSLRSRITALETSASSQNNNNNNNNNQGGGGGGGSNRNMRRRVNRLTNRISTLETTVANLQALLTTNECLSNPCANGGTCVDMYNGYMCRCPPNWQGSRCTDDVNECYEYAGTDLGCQNGATCINTQGGFSCTCAPNFYGVHCAATHDDCASASQTELCGHGTCVNVPRTATSQPTIRCICDEGWTKQGSNPACVVDVDECSTGSRCSQDPLVPCINIPGSFVCGQCPAGFIGNGYTCSDINECALNNGGCSISPRVDCINTRGSRTCGPCPSGYQGNGVTCTYIGLCNVNNGGCHPTATCQENTGGFGLRCVCPSGYVGNGVGSNGCLLPAQAGACSSNPCQNGAACNPIGTNSFSCTCAQGYTGRTCQDQTNACASNPCQNGGTCTQQGTGYSCQCTDRYTGTNCQQTQDECGGYLQGASGSFRYPVITGTTYSHRASCAWVITVAPDKVIRASFNSFNLEPHVDCLFDFLQIHDGGAASAYMIGKYCGQALPEGGVINSTHNQLYFWFKSDATVSSDGFEVSWTSQDPVCGGHLSGVDHGSINSPGYPGNYPHNRDCVWTVAVSPGSNMILTFAYLALEQHNNCSFDFLEVRDGETEQDPILGRYCDTTSPPPVHTTGPFAFVRFHSDGSRSDRGFHLTYAAVSGNGVGCGETFNADSGTVQSPGYPSAYNNDNICVWVISVSAGNTISLTFTDFDLEADTSCVYDYVAVYDGNDESDPLLGTFCGTDSPAPITSRGNYLMIEMRTDESVTGRGFRATWDTACGGSFIGTQGTIQSPSYPQNYPHDKTCNYVIEVPDGNNVRLTFTDFLLEAAADCAYDYVEIRDGPDESAPLIGSRYCGSNMPSDIMASSTQMFVKFVTDGSESNRGFQATYLAVESTGCGRVYNEETGVIRSPGHPNEYPHGINCTWYINVQPGEVIRLIFDMFSLESQRGSICYNDYVEIYDNSTMVPESKLGRFCGSYIPSVLTSSENSMVIFMNTDSSVSRGGFSAHYVALNGSTLCGEDLVSTSGVITSPNYPGNYPHDRQCDWTITAPEGNQIEINVTDIQMEYHYACNYDYLEIRNGGFESSPLVGKYCGTNAVPPILAHSNRIFIRFKTDHSRTAKGFRLEYNGASSGCGGDLTGQTGAIVSPNYPQPYSHNSECFWTITVSQGSTIDLAFVDFDVERAYRCHYDYLEIREDGPNGRQLGKFCGNTLPGVLSSSTNRVWLKYKTDATVGGRGFRLQYYSNCNTRLSGHSGVIESPNFPNPHYHNSNCTWIIDASQGNKINVSFAAFHLEGHTTCLYDKLEIRDGDNKEAPVLGTYCQNVIPDPIRSTGSSLWLNFISDASIAKDGFRLEWVVDGCGGYLTGDEGSLQSPNYPNPYPHSRECLWIITVSTGKSVQLNISDFDLESHGTCRFDALEVYAGRDANGPRIAQLCHPRTEPMVVHSTGNIMFVRLRTDSSRNGKGFTATYTAIDGGCGGNFTAPSAAIMSKNYPDNYEPNTECEWLITVAEGHVVVLNFTDFQVEGSGCDYDYVNLYDGDNPNATLIASLCGLSLSANDTLYRSNSNQMFVRMRTDQNVQHKGFKAEYTTGCGGNLDADVDGVITSPNYPQLYERGIECTWVISSSYTSRRVFLTFTHMDINDRFGGCSSAYVSVNDGMDPVWNDTDVPQNAYCGDSLPATITSRGSAMTVMFHSGTSYRRGTGFRAIYSSAMGTCGGTFSAASGRFTSPLYPDSYPNYAECVWQINTSPGNSIRLNFPIFNLDPYGDINNDYVEIRSPDVNGQLIGRFFANNEPTINMTQMHGVWIKFRSDESIVGPGFEAEWSPQYGGDLTGNTGQIASPGYPNTYPDRMLITWTITVDVEPIRVVRITFESFELEGGHNSDCPFDYVEIFDGDVDNGVSLGKFCGITIPDPVYSTGNLVTVQFKTDTSVTFGGFLLTYDAVYPFTVPAVTAAPAQCGGPLTATDELQTLTSPGYPTGYADHTECEWMISVPEGSSIAVNITALNLESHGRCSYDYVAFYNRETTSTSEIAKLCDANSYDGNLIRSTGNQMMVRFHTDYSQNGTGFAITYQKACGGSLRSETGIITSPGYPSNYPANQNCTWRISTFPGNTIGLTFSSRYNIADTGDCNNDYILLLNGLSTDAPPLYLNGSTTNTNGRYCGRGPPRGLETSSENLVVQFISDGSESGIGFSLTYNQIGYACGGRLRLTDVVTSGYVTSPNYPQNYPHYLDCVWVIIGPTGKRIQLDFEGDFYIERHQDCRFDFLEYRDGGTPNSPLIGERACGNTLPATVRSTGSVLYVRFRTDFSVTHAGFKAKYSLGACGGRVVAGSATITSPNFPANYPNNLDCEWNIQTTTGHYIVFNISRFDLQASSGCSADYLQIRDGNSTSDVIFNECGMQTFQQLNDTSDAAAYVRFKTDGSQARPGFSLTYTASEEECGGTFTAPSGVIMSPGYPNVYNHRRNCLWIIKVAKGRRVTLTFTDFRGGVEGRTRRTCYRNNIYTYNGANSDSPIIKRVCGQDDTTEPIESSDNGMRVVFRSDARSGSFAFRAEWSSNNEAECGGYLTTSPGNITSPGFAENGNYSHNIQCSWQIENRATTGSIKLKFTYMGLELGSGCNFDSVSIREGVDESGYLIGKFCGNRTDIPDIILPTTNAFVQFRTDHSVTWGGFNLMYQFSSCGGILTNRQGVISSPNYPINYGSNLACAWKIQGPENSRIRINFMNMDLESTENCTADYIRIQNGGYYDSPVIGTYCGTTLPALMTTQSNEIRVIMVTNDAQSGSGFRMFYNAVTGACGGVYHSDTGRIESPNYPSNYPHSTECRWDINVRVGYVINMTFIPPFDLEHEGTCDYDYVEVFDAFANGSMISKGRWCQNETPPPQTSVAHRMVVVFRSDYDTNGHGFAANWTTQCGGVLEGDTGTIISPNYPANYPDNLECSYLISPGAGKKIILNFTDFQLEGGSSCRFDYVTVRQGSSITGRFLGKFCGSTIPSPLVANDQIHVQFITDGSETHKGFRIEYSTEECGGTLTNNTGTIQSAFYPRNYPNNENCAWNISVTDNMIIKFKFNALELESGGSCQYDVVEFFDGTNASANSLGRYCGRMPSPPPPMVTSSSNRIFVRFTTDGSIVRSGFQASYWATYGPAAGCGGTLRQSSGQISTNNIGGTSRYPTYLDCVWLIYVNANKLVNFAVSSMDVESAPSCTKDYLMLYDGETLDAPVLGKYCGSSIPSSVLSSSNVVRVVFHSDGDGSGTGFTASFSENDALCGGALNATSTPQTIASPNYPNAAGLPVRCQWIIDSGSTVAGVRLTVTDIQLQSSDNCSGQEYLYFRDRPMTSIARDIKYCGTQIPQSFYSVNQQVMVIYNVPTASSTAKFQLTYAMADCNRNYTAPSGWLTSPGYPGEYPHNSNCVTTVAAPAGSTLAFYFRELGIEPHPACNFDYLQIKNSSDVEVAKLCGYITPSPVFINGSSATLTFVTDMSVRHTGYAVTYVASTAGLGCGGAISGVLAGDITSPGFPSNATSVDMTCEWTITPPAHRTLAYTVTISWGGGTGGGCPASDSLLLTSGSTLSVVTRLCQPGTFGPTNFNVPLTVRYRSSGSGNAPVFSLTFGQAISAN